MACGASASRQALTSDEQVASASDGPEMALVRALEKEVATLRERLDEMLENVHEMLAGLEMLAVDGYFVKVWPDLESGEWVAHCPTVRAVAQAGGRDAVVEAIGSSIGEMLQALADVDVAPPQKDVA